MVQHILYDKKQQLIINLNSMNVFILAKDPVISAQYHCDKHIVKMPLETAQMLCTIIDIWTEGTIQVPYKPTHRNHPCTKWGSISYKNFRQLIEIGRALCKEYTYRYNKRHKCEDVINQCAHIGSWVVPSNVKRASATAPPQCMPDEYKSRSVVTAYRNYYIGDKSHLFNWTNRNQPKFI